MTLEEELRRALSARPPDPHRVQALLARAGRRADPLYDLGTVELVVLHRARNGTARSGVVVCRREALARCGPFGFRTVGPYRHGEPMMVMDGEEIVEVRVRYDDVCLMSPPPDLPLALVRLPGRYGADLSARIRGRLLLDPREGILPRIHPKAAGYEGGHLYLDGDGRGEWVSGRDTTPRPHLVYRVTGVSADYFPLLKEAIRLHVEARQRRRTKIEALRRHSRGLTG